MTNRKAEHLRSGQIVGLCLADCTANRPKLCCLSFFTVVIGVFVFLFFSIINVRVSNLDSVVNFASAFKRMCNIQ